jgi:membrane-associated phospholipid phosphatase
VLASLALLAATAVAIGMVARGAHYFTDVVAGAAVGTGMVLACALILDRLWPDPRRPGSHRTGSPRGHWGRATPVRSAQ